MEALCEAGNLGVGLGFAGLDHARFPVTDMDVIPRNLNLYYLTARRPSLTTVLAHSTLLRR
jgi:hypothetical protein